MSLHCAHSSSAYESPLASSGQFFFLELTLLCCELCVSYKAWSLENGAVASYSQDPSLCLDCVCTQCVYTVCSAEHFVSLGLSI